MHYGARIPAYANRAPYSPPTHPNLPISPSFFVSPPPTCIFFVPPEQRSTRHGQSILPVFLDQGCTWPSYRPAVAHVINVSFAGLFSSHCLNNVHNQGRLPIHILVSESSVSFFFHPQLRQHFFSPSFAPVWQSSLFCCLSVVLHSFTTSVSL